MDWFHLVARTRRGHEPFLDPKVCAWTWARLREQFPVTAAAILMPDHLHLLVSGSMPSELRLRLSNTLRWLSRKWFPEARIWEPVPEAEPIRDRKHLLRQIRYVHLNPNRSSLVRDPLEWEWSTHRDWTGLVTEPWPALGRCRTMFGWKPAGVEERIHRYVSGDPTVKIEGTPLAIASPFDLQARLECPPMVQRAFEIAYRATPGTATVPSPEFRSTIRFLARHSDRSLSQIARRLGVSRQAVWKITQTGDLPERETQLVFRILSDDRLLRGAERVYTVSTQAPRR